MNNAGHGLTVNPPIPNLAQAAHGLGHINLEHDSDGVVRSVFLYEGKNHTWWPHFAVALLQAGNATRQIPMPAVSTGATTAPTSTQWQRVEQRHIPFRGGVGNFKTIPYVSVLRGEEIGRAHV